VQKKKTKMSTRYKDIAGQRFGKLVAEEYVGKNEHNFALWRCKCDCGNTAIVTGSSLRSGTTKSCGCLRERNITGQRFGRLVAIKKVGKNAHRYNLWLCECDCGNTAEVATSALIGGHTQSCGCLMRETASKTMTTHGRTNERLHVLWREIKQRCSNPNNISYKYYGGRGVTVCEEWADNYMAFREWAYSNGYDEYAKRGDCTIDRIDVNGNYEPSNCRWVDMKTQIRNQRPRKKGYKRGAYNKHKDITSS